MSSEQKNGNISENDSSSMTIEEGFEYLEEAVEKLSHEDISLEDSFVIFEKGMKVLREIGGKIDSVEKKVQMINEEGETVEFQ